MNDASVSRMTLPVCIEVGEPGKSYMEASVQLGVWCCAGLLKLQELRAHYGTVEGGQILPLFGWTAIGMDWKLHIAYQDPASNEVVRTDFALPALPLCTAYSLCGLECPWTYQYRWC